MEIPVGLLNSNDIKTNREKSYYFVHNRKKMPFTLIFIYIIKLETNMGTYSNAYAKYEKNSAFFYAVLYVPSFRSLMNYTMSQGPG